MQTVKLSTFDRLVNIQQLAETNTIKRINKRLLQEQVIANLELDRLNQQLSQTNLINRQMLENQIKEIEHREKQKFYKDLSFKNNALAKAIFQINEPVLRYYFFNKYCNKLQQTAFSAEENLEEISDKVFNHNVIIEIDQQKREAQKLTAKFNESPLSRLDEATANLNGLKAKVLEITVPKLVISPPKVKAKDNPFRLIGLIIFGILSVLFGVSCIYGLVKQHSVGDFISAIVLTAIPLTPFSIILKKDLKWRKNYSRYLAQLYQAKQEESNKQQRSVNEKQSEINALNQAINNHYFHSIYNQIIMVFPNFEDMLTRITELDNRYFSMQK